MTYSLFLKSLLTILLVSIFGNSVHAQLLIQPGYWKPKIESSNMEMLKIEERIKRLEEKLIKTKDK